MNIIIYLIKQALAAFIAAMLAAMPAAELPKEEVVKEVPEVVQEVEPVMYDDHVYINDIDVRVVKINATSTYELQAIVDDPNTAVCYQYSKCLYIGDHSNQAFATLPQVKVGDTMYWQGKTYTCYYADDYGYLDSMGYIRLSDGQQLYDQTAIALVTCKTDITRYVRLFKEV